MENLRDIPKSEEEMDYDIAKVKVRAQIFSKGADETDRVRRDPRRH